MEAPVPFRRILVATDSVGQSDGAVLRGVRMAREFGAHLSFVHAVEVPSPMWIGISDEQLAAMHATALAGARQEVEAHLVELLASEPDPPRVSDDLRVLPGNPARVLHDQADEQRADLILLGPHAKRSIFDIGSTTRSVLSHVDCPVWTQPTPVEPVERILVPIDFSEHSRTALETARDVAERIGASIRVLHVWSPPDFAYSSTSDALLGPTYVVDNERKGVQRELERWMEELDWGTVSASHAFVEGDVLTEIELASESADLIVLGTHGRTGLTRFLLGSVAHATLKQGKKPSLVVPCPARTWLLGGGPAMFENASEKLLHT